MNNQRALMLTMAFFVSGIGAKGCDFGKIGEGQAPAEPAPQKPFCLTDPPSGCMAICVELNQVGFTDNCTLPGSGPRTALFKETVFENVTISTAQGMPLCDDENELFINSLSGVTSCAAGYPPQVLQSESLDACAPPPPGCL
jgi:hypothetical protein